MRTDDREWLLAQRRIVGARVRALREERGLSQLQLGEMAGMSDKTISRLEHGVQAYTVDQLHQLAKALGVGAWRFFYG